jgi:carboxyl-terminal processing protease
MSLKKIADMMFSRKTLPVLAVLLIGGLLLAVNTSGLINPPDKYQQIFAEVTELLEEAHFSPKKIDDAFSKTIFKKYLAALDDDRNIFLQSDIRELKAYETRIDDELHGAPIQFFYAADQIYQKRLKEVSDIYKEFLKQPFTYGTPETFKPEPGDNDYPATPAARREQWRKRLKFMCLDRYADLLDQRDANKGQKDFVVKTDAQLEQEARTRVQTIMERSFQRRNVRFTEEERFNLLVNTVTETMDPHTRFFPPIEKRSFDEQMSGRFYGIGASLREEDGTIRIATLVTGMPAWKSGEFAVGDQVVKVGQGADEPVDVSGYEVEDAVKLIRGKKGTEVRITLRKADGSIKVINLIRDEIVLDETYARSAIVKQDGRKVGYIFLPEFYADWERPNGARSAQDVYKEVLKLREQKVDGIILDLRNNGGGSLYDVVQIAGFFIPEGPIVQVKDRDGNPSVLRDRDRSVLYDGPLAIMVNQFSASASEIMAAAMQDYNRGIVVGSSSTYGKGTVQRNIGLERATSINQGADVGELGSLKLTLQKFYRVNGGSTQQRGVTPDIILPDQYEYLKMREKDTPDALPWDEITKAPINPSRPTYQKEAVTAASYERLNANPAFNAIKEATAKLKKSTEGEQSLNLAKYRAEQKSIRDAIRRIDTLARNVQALEVDLLPQDLKALSQDEDKLERRKQWSKNVGRDIQVQETMRIIGDMNPVNGVVVRRD